MKKINHHNSKRFFDDEDFTPEHDEMFLWLLQEDENEIKNWQKMFVELIPQIKSMGDGHWYGDVGTWDSFVGTLKGEPMLHGYPPLFPDALCSGSFRGNHMKIKGKPLKIIINHDKGKRGLDVACSHLGCTRGGFLKFKPKNPSPKDNNKDEWEEYKKKYSKNKYWVDPCYGPSYEAYVEIKPKINSFGKVLRQLQMYKERGRENVILVTKDGRFNKQFREQGFLVYEIRGQTKLNK